MNAPAVLGPWANFYLMTGGAAASLTGLMFVVITLVQNLSRESPTRDGISTFSTPTVTHFAGVLIIAAVMLAPWHRTTIPALLLGVAGAVGVIYVSVLIVRTTRMTTSYSADVEDWFWYNVVPLVNYALIFAGGVLLLHASVIALFLIGAACVLFVVAGIHNAWDIVTYLAVKREDNQ